MLFWKGFKGRVPLKGERELPDTRPPPSDWFSTRVLKLEVFVRVAARQNSIGCVKQQEAVGPFGGARESGEQLFAQRPGLDELALDSVAVTFGTVDCCAVARDDVVI
jgi:hypothetical protein